MFLLSLITLIAPVLSLTADFNLIWYEANKTEPHRYTARQELPESIEKADKISLDQKISVLRNFDLGFAVKLKTLTMDNCGLTDIEPDSFKNVPALSTLSITGNNMKVIKQGVFNYMDVQHVNLSHNKITTIKPTAFDNMKNLKSLLLDHNDLTVYALWFENCPNVSVISVTFNFIQYLPEGLFKWVKSHKLNAYFSYNKVRKIHPDAFDVQEFGDFCLDHNEITELDYAVKRIHNLDLRDNHLECLPDAFIEKELNKITVVDLRENPTNCGCLKKLQKYRNVLAEALEEEC